MEKDLIITSSSTPATLSILDQDKRKCQDQIDVSDQELSLIGFQNYVNINSVGQVQRPGDLLAASVRFGTASTKVSHRKSAKTPPLWFHQARWIDSQKDSKLQSPNVQQYSKIWHSPNIQQSSNVREIASSSRHEKKSGLLNICEENSGGSKETTYAAATALVLEEEKLAEIGLQCFEQRVLVLSAACIPCLFYQHKQIEVIHSNCLQDQYSCLIDQFRLGIKFNWYISCF